MRYSIESNLITFKDLSKEEAIGIVQSLISDNLFFEVFNTYGKIVTSEFTKK